MRTIRSHPWVIYTIVTIQIIVTLLAGVLCPHYTQAIFYLHWLCLASALLIVIKPTKIDASPEYTTTSWLIKILRWQFSLFSLFLCFTYLLPNTPALTATWSVTLVQYGLFPWGLIALLTVGFLLLAQRRQRDIFINDFVAPDLSKEGKLWGTLAACGRQGTGLALITSLILVSYAIFHLWPQAHLGGFNLTTLLIVFLFIIFAFSQRFKKFTPFILKKQRVMLGWISLPIGMGLIFLLLAALLHPLSHHSLNPPQFITALQTHHTHAIILLGTSAWWLSWSIISAIYFANISRGRSLRATILMILCVPACLAAIFYSTPNLPTLPHTLRIQIVLALLAILSFVYLSTQLFNRDFLPQLLLNYYSREKTPKWRDHHFYLRRVIQITLVIYYVFLPVGTVSLSLILFGMLLPTLCLLPILVARTLGASFSKT